MPASFAPCTQAASNAASVQVPDASMRADRAARTAARLAALDGSTTACRCSSYQLRISGSLRMWTSLQLSWQRSDAESPGFFFRLLMSMSSTEARPGQASCRANLRAACSIRTVPRSPRGIPPPAAAARVEADPVQDQHVVAVVRKQQHTRVGCVRANPDATRISGASGDRDVEHHIGRVLAHPQCVPPWRRSITGRDWIRLTAQQHIGSLHDACVQKNMHRLSATATTNSRGAQRKRNTLMSRHGWSPR